MQAVATTTVTTAIINQTAIMSTVATGEASRQEVTTGIINQTAIMITGATGAVAKTSHQEGTVSMDNLIRVSHQEAMAATASLIKTKMAADSHNSRTETAVAVIEVTHNHQTMAVVATGATRVVAASLHSEAAGHQLTGAASFVPETKTSNSLHIYNDKAIHPENGEMAFLLLLLFILVVTGGGKHVYNFAA